MVVETSALVLSSIKYGESSIILRCYTQQFGIKSFIVKGVLGRKKKNNSNYFPLSEVELNFKHKNNSNALSFLSQIQSLHYYESIHFHPIKSSIVLFLSEVLHSVLKEEEKNIHLYAFIKNSFVYFDEKQQAFSDFHLCFLLDLTSYLGFYPNQETKELPIFDLENGIFTQEMDSVHLLKPEETNLFRKLIEYDFETSADNQFNQQQRKVLIHVLMNYYRLHISDFKTPKSLEVLYQLFS